MDVAARCLMCGREYTAHNSRSRFCCSSCRSAWNRMHVGERAPRPAPAPAASTPGMREVSELVAAAHGVQAGLSAAAEAGVPSIRPMCRRLADAIGDALEREGL